MSRLTARDVRDMLAAYQDGTAAVDDILRYHGVSAATLYYHLDQAGVPRRRPVVRLEVGEVVDVSLHVLPVIPVRFVARPGDRPLPEASLPADSGALVASRASDSLALPGEEDSLSTLFVVNAGLDIGNTVDAYTDYEAALTRFEDHKALDRRPSLSRVSHGEPAYSLALKHLRPATGKKEIR